MEQTKLLSGKSYLWLGIFFGVLIWSGIEPKDRLTWVLEAGPAVHRSFHNCQNTDCLSSHSLLYFWILLHCIVLMVGAKYTYAEVPFFDWISEMFGWERNNYDKVGHFMQGFVPALLTREILIRKKVVNFPGWQNFIIISICLAFSAFYELIEWWAALLLVKMQMLFWELRDMSGILSQTCGSPLLVPSVVYSFFVNRTTDSSNKTYHKI